MSIIALNYNCERFIAQTIKGVLSQTYQNLELLIQDDYSTDDSCGGANDMPKKTPELKLR